MTCKVPVKILSLLLCAAVLSCMFPGGSLLSEASDEWKLYYWGFENTLSDEGKALTGDVPGGRFDNGKNGKALDVVESGSLKTAPLTVDTTKGYTMAAWINLNYGAEGFNIIVSKGNTMVELTDRFQIHIGQASEEVGGGYLKVFSPAIIETALPNDQDNGEINFVPYGEWTHVAVTYNGEKAVIYLNGRVIHEEAVNSTLNASQGLYNMLTIGALNHDGQTFLFDGLIDEVVYANYPMPVDQISLLAADPSAAAAKLKALATGGEEIKTDNIVISDAPVGGDDDDGSKIGGEALYFWPLDGDGNDMSHNQLDLEYYDSGFEYEKGVVNDCGVIAYGGSVSVPFEDEADFSCFTVAFWMKWDGGEPGYWVMYAMAGKENPYHFEIYLASADGENALLSVYNTAVGNAIEGLSGLKSDTLYHIAITYNGQLLTAYVNGQLAAEMKLNLDLDGMGSGEDSIALGSLVDGTLYQSGFLDEVILADYVLDKDLIVKLAEKPEEARAEIELLVKNNYPEGYIKTETSKPTEAPAGESAKPNETAAVGTSAEKTPLLTPTKAPLRTGGSQDISLALIIVIIVSAVVIIAAAALIAVKKIKENKKK